MCEIPEEVIITCQLSFYPLAQTDIHSDIDHVLVLIENSGLFFEIGEMSTYLKGPQSKVFELLEQITTDATKNHCKFVLQTTISNTCGIDE